MPTLDVSLRDLSRLVGKKLTCKQMEEYSLYAKGELEKAEGDRLKIDVKDTNRPDLWSAEGVAREIRLRLGKGGLKAYATRPSGLVVNVQGSVSKVRPLTVCAVVKGLKIDEETLAQIIQLQEKVALTFGRRRKEAAIGVYDYDVIRGPITYKGVRPTGLKFAPLGFEEPMTPKQILSQHPKGKEYGSLLKGKKRYPLFIDANGEVLSMPPIINSNYSGKVDESTRNLFIEVSGFDFKFLMPALNVMVAAMADRGGKIYSVKVKYGGRTIVTPDMRPKKTRADMELIRKISGMDLKDGQIRALLERSGYSVKTRGKWAELLYPPYRQDLMHTVDVAEDVLITYGYNNISPDPLNLVSTGRVSRLESFSKDVREILLGLGAQEVMTFTLTNKEDLFKKMSVKDGNVVEIENPVSSRWSTLRNRLAPSLMGFLSRNTHKRYPQCIFEVGDAVRINERSETRTDTVRLLCYLEAKTDVNFTELKRKLEAFFRAFGTRPELRPVDHPSFIPGRCAHVYAKGKRLGIIGEIHPQVLDNWKVEMPVGCFEINVQKLMELPHPTEQVV